MAAFSLMTFSVKKALRVFINCPRLNVSSCPSLKQIARLPRLDVNNLNPRTIHTSVVSGQENKNQDFQLKRELPCLMNNPTHIIWPSFFKSITNLLSASVIIKPYFDNDFSLKEFSKGAKQALFVISKALSVGDVDSLQDLVDKNVLVEIKENLNRYSADHLAELEIHNPDDVYLTFPYQVGIIMNDTEKGVQERFVEITVCFHVFEGLSELIEKEGFQPGPSSMQKHRDKIIICNYRFLREFTKNTQDGDWRVNLIHHFRLVPDS